MPGKIKHFIWKACSNSLPTKDVFHALWGCEKLLPIQDSDFGRVDRDRITSDSFSDIPKLIQERPYLVALFAATAWSIWYHRNKTRLQQSSLSLEKISGFAKDYARDFAKQNRSFSSTRQKVIKRWCPPYSDLMKVNFDGVMFNKRDEAGIGVIIRNSKGEVVVALSEKIQKPSSAEILELLAAKKVV